MKATEYNTTLKCNYYINKKPNFMYRLFAIIIQALLLIFMSIYLLLTEFLGSFLQSFFFFFSIAHKKETNTERTYMYRAVHNSRKEMFISRNHEKHIHTVRTDVQTVPKYPSTTNHNHARQFQYPSE